jgi:hypothetical protein
MLNRLSTPTGTGRTTSRDGCRPQSLLQGGFPRNAAVECVRCYREMVEITRVACRFQLLLRRSGMIAVDDCQLPRRNESLLARERKEGRTKKRSEKE